MIGLGDVARDRITGFTGVVIARTEWTHNCDRLMLQPREVKDGKPIDGRSFDEPGLEFVERTDLVVIPPSRPEVKIELDDTARDRISGLVGVVIGRTEWLNGCSRVILQPRELKDGVPVDPSTFDESDLALVERAAKVVPEAPVAKKTGGPRAEPRRR